MTELHPRIPRVAWYRRWLAQPGFLVRRPFLRRRLRRRDTENIEGLDIEVFPGVHHPGVFRSGAWFAAVLAHAPLEVLGPFGDHPAPRALDLGTGSGLQALILARRGFRVLAADVDPVAVRCARHNAQIHRLADRVQCVQADLFAPFGPGRFHLVVSNPPFFHGVPAGALDAAWRSTDLPERFARGLGAVLAPDGAALLLLSTDGVPERFIDGLDSCGWWVRAIARKDFGSEIMTVYRVQRP